MVHRQGNCEKYGLAVRGVCALALGLCLSAGAQARQEQPAQQDQQQDQPQPQSQPPDQQQPQQAPAPDAPSGPKYYPQDANRPPYSNDHPALTAPGRHAPPPWEYAPEKDTAPNGAAQATPAPNANDAAPRTPAPASLTVPPGTVLQVSVNEYLSSDRNQVGDRFTAVLQAPIVVNGWVVARRGQLLTGQVEAAVKAGRVKGTSQLGLEITDLTVVDGQQKPVLTELWKGSGGKSHGQDAATVGGTTALGAAIGAAADWGVGAAIGAGAGAAAGIGAVLLTRGRPTVIEPETQLNFRLVDPVTIDTTQSQQAFLPVSQQDYEGGRESRPHLAARYARPWYPGPAYYDCGYYQPCYAYPGYFGYPGYWGGPSFYFGGFYGGGFHRGFRR
jgi:hypothetical protein